MVKNERLQCILGATHPITCKPKPSATQTGTPRTGREVTERTGTARDSAPEIYGVKRQKPETSKSRTRYRKQWKN